jgi:hypothetical protein
MKRVLYIVIPLLFATTVSGSVYYSNQKIKQKDLEMAKVQQQIDELRKKYEESSKTPENPVETKDTIVEDTTPKVTTPVYVKPVVPKVPVYVSQMGVTYNCESIGISAINQANAYIEKQNDAKTECLERTKGVIQAQVDQCTKNLHYACGINSDDDCIDDFYDNCKKQLVYDDCESFNTSTSNLSSLINQYCD